MLFNVYFEFSYKSDFFNRLIFSQKSILTSKLAVQYLLAGRNIQHTNRPLGGGSFTISYKITKKQLIKSKQHKFLSFENVDVDYFD